MRDASATSDPGSLGMCASRRVPSPGGLVSTSRPSSTASRSISPRRPVPPSTVAPPLPSSVTTTTTSPPWRLTCDGGVAGLGVAHDVGQAFGDDEVRGGLDRRRQALVELDGRLDVQRRPRHQRLDRGADAALGQERGMDAARELAQLRERDRELLADLVDGAREPAVRQPRLEHPQVEREADELLLGAVVQVALDPPARVVGGLDDPQPRDPQLLHPRAQLGLQALVVDRQRGGRGGGGDELRRGVELGVVDDRRHAHALALDRGPRAAGAGVGQLDRAAGVVDEDLALGQPVGDVQRAVAEPLGQHLAHRPALGDARAQQPAGERAQRGADALQRGDRDDRRRAARAGTARRRRPGRAPTDRRAARRRPRAR